MNYLGSKLSLLEFLEESINKVVDKNCHTFCDLFAGTGIVGRYFKTRGYKMGLSPNGTLRHSEERSDEESPDFLA